MGRSQRRDAWLHADAEGFSEQATEAAGRTSDRGGDAVADNVVGAGRVSSEDGQETGGPTKSNSTAPQTGHQSMTRPGDIGPSSAPTLKQVLQPPKRTGSSSRIRPTMPRARLVREARGRKGKSYPPAGNHPASAAHERVRHLPSEQATPSGPRADTLRSREARVCCWPSAPTPSEFAPTPCWPSWPRHLADTSSPSFFFLSCFSCILFLSVVFILLFILFFF